MKKMKFFVAVLALITIPLLSVNAYDMHDIAAYPVPFNPKRDTLKIGDPDSWSNGNTYSLKADIYDINGDLVRRVSGNSPRIIWNGRDGNGRYVKPGLYIIKIVTEYTDGDYGKKIIRILVDY